MHPDGTFFTSQALTARFSSFTKAKTPNGSSDWAGIAPYRFAAVEGTSEVVLNTPLPLSEDGVDEPSFSILKGNYIFTLDLEARTLTVEPNEAESMYIIGAAPFGGWNSNAGVKMEQASEGVYTYECEIAETAWTSASCAWTTPSTTRCLAATANWIPMSTN